MEGPCPIFLGFGGGSSTPNPGHNPTGAPGLLGAVVAERTPQTRGENQASSSIAAANSSNPGSPSESDDYFTIGGDSVASIRQRILSRSQQPMAYEEAQYKAEDLFDIKSKLILEMAKWDVEGDWMNRGARALDCPNSHNGEYSLELLYRWHKDLADTGVLSDTFSLLKERVLKKQIGRAHV